MAKVLLVEDDNNLREIFEMRLKAEGYNTITAGNGEEALVVAMKEKPDLIIADVMMPKLSGFEMLETLRAAPEMANTKAIMMTALGQAEDRARGERLGVIKYLVKSQVTLEDFVRVVREVVAPDGSSGTTEAGAGLPQSASTNSQLQNNQESEQSMQEDNTQNTPAPADSGATDQTSMPNPISNDSGAVAATPEQPTAAEEQTAVQGQIDNFVSSTPTSDAPAADTSAPAAPADTTGTDAAAAPTDVSSAPEIPVSTPPAETAPQPPTESGDGTQSPSSNPL